MKNKQLNALMLTQDNFERPIVLINDICDKQFINGIQSVHDKFDAKNHLAAVTMTTVCSEFDISGDAEISYYKGNVVPPEFIKKITALVSINYSWKNPNDIKIIMDEKIIPLVQSLIITAEADTNPQKWKIDITVYDYSL